MARQRVKANRTDNFLSKVGSLGQNIRSFRAGGLNFWKQRKVKDFESEGIIVNRPGKKEILEVLRQFEGDRHPYKPKKFEYATKLIAFSKSALESVKADLEASSNDGKNLIAFFVNLTPIVGALISSWFFEDPKIIAWIALLTVLYFTSLKNFTLYLVIGRDAWLHIVKEALSLKLAVQERLPSLLARQNAGELLYEYEEQELKELLELQKYLSQYINEHSKQ